MQKQSSSRPSRCLPSTIPAMLYPLIFAVFLTVIVMFSIHTSCPYNVFTASTTTTHDQVRLPPSIHSQISHLQAQVGQLLQQLHTETEDTKIKPEYSHQVLAIAVSLDKLAETLSRLYQEPPVRWNTSTIEVTDISQPREEDDEVEEGLMNQNHKSIFTSEEFHQYTSPKFNRNGKKNFLQVDTVYTAVGLACAASASNLDRLMSYKLYGPCPDDWVLAQKLIVSGCDPLPRRRCFSKSPPHYTKPLPLNSSLWNLPSDANIRWDHYKCKSFSCLISNETAGKRGFFKCADCFDLTKRGWVFPTNETISPEFTIDEVLLLKPGEIRIGMDFSPTTGTFAALMKEKNVTIATATLNLGAPFNEVIALRGILPLYLSVGSRLPFFDNTLDIVHSTLFLDGWIGVELLQYVLMDWDRVLRPKGLLWVDRFFCATKDMKLYTHEFEKLGYKKLLWRVLPKTDKLGNELFFSAVLEKPLRA